MKGCIVSGIFHAVKQTEPWRKYPAVFNTGFAHPENSCKKCKLAPMQSIIRSRLQAARKELLDLGLRNPLIHFRPLQSRGVCIVQERSADVYRLLVTAEKQLYFDAQREGAKNEKAAPNGEAAFLDTRLQTAEAESVLQKRLLNTYYAARTSIEEQGVNILFLALGMVHWYESDSSNEVRRAPALLVPVVLERSSARERFSLRYTLEEVGENLSLIAKARAEFGLDLPLLPEEEELSIENYFAALQNALQPQSRWRLEPDEIELGFFSFGKFMIYHDLDEAQWPENKNPASHPLLQSLLHSGFSDGAPSVGEDAFIDQVPEANSLFQVVDADSSQILAMLAVHEGRNLVVQGPPGTGKSQTITNIIANAVGQGKKVLFVAEKLAALEVVKRRLDALQLGEACLELHSHKANKKDLHAELRRVLELGKPALQHLQQQVGLLDTRREELNAYSQAVNTEVQNSGLTPHALAGLLLQLSEKAGSVSLPRLAIPDLLRWDAAQMRKAEDLAAQMEARLRDMGVPAAGLFWGTGLRVLLPHEQDLLNEHLQQALAGVAALQGEGSQIAQNFHFAHPENREAAMALAQTLELLAQHPGVAGVAVAQKDWLEKQEAIAAWLAAGHRFAAIKQQYQDLIIPEAWSQDVMPIRQELMVHGNKWYRFLIGSYKKAVKQLQGLSKTALPKNLETRLQWVDAILEVQRLRLLVLHPPFDAAQLFGARWQQETTNWEVLQQIFDFLHLVHRQVEAGKVPEAIFAVLQRNEPPENFRQYHQVLLSRINDHGRTLQLVSEKLALNEGLRFGGTTLLHLAFSDQALLLQQWSGNLPFIHQAISWNNLEDVATAEGFAFLPQLAAHWKEAGHYLKMALQKTWYEHLLEQAFHTLPPLRKFERNTHEEIIEQFARLDVLNLHLNRARAALAHWEAMPEPEGGGQMTVLRTEFNKKSRHKPIRKLMREAGLAIQAIKPVLMMSPLSIANFLPPGALEFDLVIFDEASQVRPVDALGAVLRGRQLVVVGDNKQLPPTSFFDALTGEAEEAESITADMQSILGLCDAQGAPQRMLRWHYRSRHQSLITVSNHQFYENKLVVPPSPGHKQGAGLVFHHLPQTAYQRGTSRTNPLEAKRVVEAILEHARKHPKLSLGVAAFSTAQRQAIQDELELQRKQHEDTEAFFRSHTEEPFFIKNLENVQGDERDVIFISVGYGRDEAGYFSMSFGPLNGDGGERRLNVLITRAKLRCEVFTNITAADIDLDRTQSAGVAALKHFLHYAQYGHMDIAMATGLPAQSPFEEAVADKLLALGYKVHRQVGSKGFYIDLAIVDPEEPGRYLLGIECDGAAYHAARSARDRDRLRQQVLEAMGWHIHRIWSTDWFRNPERELKRVVEAVEQSWKQKLDGAAEAEDEVPATTILREAVTEVSGKLDDYELAKLPPEIASKEMHLHPVGKMARWVEMVVAAESPVHEDEVVRRMVEAAGVTRIGPRIRDHVKLAIRFTEGSGRILRKGEFLWYAGHTTAPLRSRATLPAASRKWKYVAPEEMGAVLEKVVGNAVAIEAEAAFPLVAKTLGFARVTEEMRSDILAIIPGLIQQGKLVQEGGVLKLEN